MPISFRKKSLEKLSSPEELDRLLNITSPMSWTALFTICFCILVATAWGIFGRVPNKISGAGILLNPKGIFSVKAQNSGTVKTVNVQLGQMVHKGDSLAIMNYPELVETVSEAQEDLTALKSQYQREQTENTRTLKEKKQERDLSVQALELDMEINQAKVTRLNQRIEDQRELLEHGLITEYDLADTIEERDSAEDRVETDESQKTAAEDTYDQATLSGEEKLQELEKQIRELEEDLEEKELSLQTDTVIQSPYDGIVVAVATEPGAWVSVGEEVLSIELLDSALDKELRCRQYYPAATAKRIQTGMTTQVAPGTVQVDQYGYLLATVSSVAEFPATTAELENDLQNDELVSEITRMGTVLAVESVLIKATDTPSGYQWTSSQGPPYSLNSGTTCSSSVIIEELPPISLVIPVLKKYLLGIGEEQK